MKLLALHSSPIPIHGISGRNSIEKSIFFSGCSLGIPANKRCTDARKSSASLDFRVRAVGSVGSSQKTANVNEPDKIKTDKDVVFVAGATGRVGSRTVRELLKLGFQVRAGVRSAQRAQTLVESVRQMKLDDSSGSKPVEKLEIIECDLENQGGIGAAIGNASIVICCIGASEKEVFDITGPYRIDYKATENLINAATVAKVDHFILVSSLGTNKIGFPAAILNLFWGVLIWKRKAEEALMASGLPYTIVRPGGMERPTDAFKETHNLTLSPDDTLFGGLVSNLQVAELMACMAKNTRLSYCKVVEAIAETTAPLTPMEELLAKIPSKRELPPEPPIPAPKPEDVVVQSEASKPRPLSPYSMYDDLKPPTSPTPTPSSSLDLQEKEQAKFTPQKHQPLSPYTVYEDLKPPTSPTPTPSIASSLKDINVDGVVSLGSNSGKGMQI
ncbi:protein TIC 62, chloroplastic isoform X1 [Dioscorea cayenensis subsp. rotundata]|uniref:Protein TIC 62, chloroplastic isoform X1 n=1 Tax=Dioscorea cayennensis subsp. rotundata TaxID=55577 RepID=A0AB40CHV8_DIOCR|nr:protein TIC 62, chloroplastic isoform X1 [Dioscorea cayenensis subsp. rotundata]